MQAKIIDYGMNGEGVAKIDGKIVLVPKALKDEVVEIEITAQHKNYDIAKLTKIITPSKFRTEPSCPHKECGGCALTHLVYSQQLKFKQQLIKKTIKKIAELDVEVNSTKPCKNQYNYRNKISFAVKNGIGFFKQNSHNLVEVEECKLADPNINKILNLFKQSELAKNAEIKNLVVRSLNNQILVGVVTSKTINLLPFYQLLNQNFKNVGLYQIKNTRNDSVVLTNNAKHIAGITHINLTDFDIKSKIDILSFLQTNQQVQNDIYNYVLKQISPSACVINAYSGAGLLSAIVAKVAKQVIGIELNPNAHKSAELLKKDNNIKNLTNINCDFNKYLAKTKNIDTIILDPPKKGCGEILNKIDTKSIIYISCNPISLAKDLRILKKHYIIKIITPFDMFPNTVSVETVVTLRRKDDT